MLPEVKLKMTVAISAVVTDRDDSSLRKSIRLSRKSVGETLRKNQPKYWYVGGCINGDGS